MFHIKLNYCKDTNSATIRSYSAITLDDALRLSNCELIKIEDDNFIEDFQLHNQQVLEYRGLVNVFSVKRLLEAVEKYNAAAAFEKSKAAFKVTLKERLGEHNTSVHEIFKYINSVIIGTSFAHTLANKVDKQGMQELNASTFMNAYYTDKSCLCFCRFLDDYNYFMC